MVPDTTENPHTRPLWPEHSGIYNIQLLRWSMKTFWRQRMKTQLSAFVGIVLASLLAGAVHAQETAALGVTMSDNRPGGTLITSVLEGSPAAKIGLQSGDRILTINGQRTDNFRDVVRIIGAAKPDTKIELSIVRGAWKTKLTGTLGSKNAVFTLTPKTVAPPKPVHTADSKPDWDPVNFMLHGSDTSAAGAYGGGGD
jgi:membrane-associated protease RseP (regulator of RpoE activity)